MTPTLTHIKQYPFGVKVPKYIFLNLMLNLKFKEYDAVFDEICKKKRRLKYNFKKWTVLFWTESLVEKSLTATDILFWNWLKRNSCVCGLTPQDIDSSVRTLLAQGNLANNELILIKHFFIWNYIYAYIFLSILFQKHIISIILKLKENSLI